MAEQAPTAAARSAGPGHTGRELARHPFSDEPRRSARPGKAAEQAQIRKANLAAGGATRARELKGQVRGKHYTEWVDAIRQLKRDGMADEALELLLECVGAAERDRDGREPAPAYTLMAAVIYRQRKNYAAEVAILERWHASCPAASRGPGTSQKELAARLTKARELLARQSE